MKYLWLGKDAANRLMLENIVGFPHSSIIRKK